MLVLIDFSQWYGLPLHFLGGVSLLSHGGNQGLSPCDLAAMLLTGSDKISSRAGYRGLEGVITVAEFGRAKVVASFAPLEATSSWTFCF